MTNRLAVQSIILAVMGLILSWMESAPVWLSVVYFAVAGIFMVMVVYRETTYTKKRRTRCGRS